MTAQTAPEEARKKMSVEFKGQELRVHVTASVRQDASRLGHPA